MLNGVEHRTSALVPSSVQPTVFCLCVSSRQHVGLKTPTAAGAATCRLLRNAHTLTDKKEDVGK